MLVSFWAAQAPGAMHTQENYIKRWPRCWRKWPKHLTAITATHILLAQPRDGWSRGMWSEAAVVTKRVGCFGPFPPPPPLWITFRWISHHMAMLAGCKWRRPRCQQKWPEMLGSCYWRWDTYTHKGGGGGKKEKEGIGNDQSTTPSRHLRQENKKVEGEGGRYRGPLGNVVNGKGRACRAQTHHHHQKKPHLQCLMLCRIQLVCCIFAEVQDTIWIPNLQSKRAIWLETAPWKGITHGREFGPSSSIRRGLLCSLFKAQDILWCA